jgi:hypothetical protein
MQGLGNGDHFPMFRHAQPGACQEVFMKKIVFALALAGLATPPLLAQPRGRAPAPLPGAHETPGELVLFSEASFAGQSRTIGGDSPAVSTPFAIHSVSIHPGDRWQICANRNFQAPCTTVTRPIADAGVIGVTGQVGSIRQIPDPNPPAN